MTTVASQSILPEFIKLRWQEPYVSAGLNRKTFKSLPRGIYNGFVVVPGPGANQLSVVHDDPRGWEQTSGFSGGAFDTASGWSIAVHESIQGFNATVAIQSGPSRNYTFDISALLGQTVYPAIDVQYVQGFSSAAEVKIVDALELELNPALLVLARVNIPAVGPLTGVNIIHDDPLYPRVLPFASNKKYGFMSKQHVEQLDFLQAVSASPAFSYETLILVDGPQVIPLPTGFTYVLGSDDLWVFRNGRKLFRGVSRDYLEIDRGDGLGISVNLLNQSLRSGDRIELRIQKYAAVQSSTTSVLDAGALIDQANVIDFEGVGVTVYPDGPRRVRVVIPGGGGGSGGAVKAKVYRSNLQLNRAVHLSPDNTVIYCDPTNLNHNFYGVTLQSAVSGNVGNVQCAGILIGAGSAPSVSGSLIGQSVYVAQDGQGTLTTVEPDPFLGTIFKVGILDGINSVSGGSPSDIVFDRGRLA